MNIYAKRKKSAVVSPAVPVCTDVPEISTRTIIIECAYDGLFCSDGSRSPEPRECLYYLVSTRLRPVELPAHLERPDRTFADESVMKRLLEIGGVWSQPCGSKKCKDQKRILPVIMCFRADERGERTRTFRIYCPFCLHTHQVSRALKSRVAAR